MHNAFLALGKPSGRSGSRRKLPMEMCGRETSAETVRPITGGAASALEAVLRWPRKSMGSSPARTLR